MVDRGVKKNKLVGIVGDLHLKEKLGYSDYINGGRSEEKKEILDFIVKELSDCDKIVFLGDNFHYKNNTSNVIREFTWLLEQFDGKKIYVLAGNHEKFGDGKSAVDYLKELNRDNWTIVTDKILNVDNMCLVPFMFKSELGLDTNEEAIEVLMKDMKDADMLFIHHAVSDIVINGAVNVSILSELVFPFDLLKKRFKQIFMGHIHTPQVHENLLVTGGIFKNEVGEIHRYIYKYNEVDGKMDRVELPGRPIQKLENPTVEEIKKIDKNRIVKAVITDPERKDDVNNIREALKKFDAYLLLEQYPYERKKIHIDDGIDTLSMDRLLEIYAKERKISLPDIKMGFNLIS